jgi:ribonucleoside-diphosphate reductase beta chain
VDDQAVSPVLVRYEHFLGIAERIAWDAEAIELSVDAAAWPLLDSARRERLRAYLAAFALAEERVAIDLRPFIDAASDSGLAACFRAQARDEERHARFFARYAWEVTGAEPLRDRVDPEFAALFTQRLRATVAALAAGRLPLAAAVELYHLELEGLVFSAGQNALLAELQACEDLPGLRDGLERVVADERWHIGLGVRVLREEGGDAVAVNGERALEAWGALLPAAQRDAALALHRRRVSAAGIS